MIKITTLFTLLLCMCSHAGAQFQCSDLLNEFTTHTVDDEFFLNPKATKPGIVTGKVIPNIIRSYGFLKTQSVAVEEIVFRKDPPSSTVSTRVDHLIVAFKADNGELLFKAKFKVTLGDPYAEDSPNHMLLYASEIYVDDNGALKTIPMFKGRYLNDSLVEPILKLRIAIQNQTASVDSNSLEIEIRSHINWWSTLSNDRPRRIHYGLFERGQ